MITLYKTAGYYTSDELKDIREDAADFLGDAYPDECKAHKVLGSYDSFIEDYANETINDIYWEDFRVNMLEAVYLPYGIRIYGVANVWNGGYCGCENLILTGGHHDGTNSYTIQALDEHGNAHKLGETIRKYYGIDSEVTA